MNIWNFFFPFYLYDNLSNKAIPQTNVILTGIIWEMKKRQVLKQWCIEK